MFKGHQFIKLTNENWVLDLTEYIGYKVKLNKNGSVNGYKEAFSATLIGNEVIFEKFTRVPLKVLREASNQIRIFNDELGAEEYE